MYGQVFIGKVYRCPQFTLKCIRKKNGLMDGGMDRYVIKVHLYNSFTFSVCLKIFIIEY